MATGAGQRCSDVSFEILGKDAFGRLEELSYRLRNIHTLRAVLPVATLCRPPHTPRLPINIHHVVRRPNTHDHCAQGGSVATNLPRFVTLHSKQTSAYCTAGTDQSQGRGQVLSNINACLAVQSTIKSTLGPYGGDLLLVDANGRQTITNDGATVMKVGLSKRYL